MLSIYLSHRTLPCIDVTSLINPSIHRYCTYISSIILLLLLENVVFFSKKKSISIIIDSQQINKSTMEDQKKRNKRIYFSDQNLFFPRKIEDQKLNRSYILIYFFYFSYLN